MNLAGRVAAGTVSAKAPSTVTVQDGFRQDAPGGVAGAEEEDVVDRGRQGMLLRVLYPG